MKQYEFMKDTDENGKSSISVSSRRKRKLDLIPRILCLFVALIIWLWMVNVNDTDVTETMVIKIEYVGLESLENDGMMMYGMDKNEVTVTIKGSNRDIRKYDADQYRLFVDLGDISDAGEYTLPMEIKIPQDSNVTLETPLPNFNFKIDHRETKSLSFDVLVTPAADTGLMKYSYISYVEPEITYIDITGPKSIVDQINTARFNVNGNFVSTNDQMEFSDFPLVFLDKNLSEVDTMGTLEYSTDDIFVNVMAYVHKDIPLNIIVTGDGSKLDYTVEPKNTISIWGTPSVIQSIEEYRIEINDPTPGHVEKIEYDRLCERFAIEFGEDVHVTVNPTIIVTFKEPVR